MTVNIIWEGGMKIVPEPSRPPAKVCWWRLSNKPPRMWLRGNKVGFSVWDQPKVPWAWALLHQLPGGANPPISRLFRTPTLPADSHRWQFHSRIWQLWDSERGHLLWQEWLQAIQVVENVGQTLTADKLLSIFSHNTRPQSYGYGQNDIFHNFRDFADIKKENSRPGSRYNSYY